MGSLRLALALLMCFALSSHPTHAQFDNLLETIQNGVLSSDVLLNLFDQISSQIDLNSILYGNNGTLNLESLSEQYANMLGLLNNYFKDNNFDFFDLNRKLENVSAPCINKTIEFIQALQKNEEWALQTTDSWGKPPSGIYNGAIHWLGEYKMCLNIKSLSKTWPSKYCIIRNLDPGVIKPNFGICISSQCSNEDITEIINFGISYLLPLAGGSSLLPIGYINKNAIDCKEAEKGVYASTIVVLILVIAIVLIVLAATAYDKVLQYRENGEKNAVKDAEKSGNEAESKPKTRRGTLGTIASSVSIFNNAKRLFHIPVNVDHFECINAIRVLSISWVVLGHTYVQLSEITNNVRTIINWLKEAWFLLIANGTFSVDTFFVMSGFLLTYFFLREAKKRNNHITPLFMFQYYFHRYWRLTPVYMLATLISAFLTRHMGNGPFFPQDGVELEMCKDTWWINLFYLQNLIGTEKICLGVSWYLANDMQFHWIAPIFLIPFALGKRMIGILICVALLIVHILSVSLLINANPAYQRGVLNLNQVETIATLINMYMKPYCRIGTFVIGVLLGYFLFHLRDQKKSEKIDYRINLILWLASIGFCLWMLLGIHPDYSDDGPLSSTSRILYQTFSRLVWSCGVAYIIYACATSNGGFINSILSHRFWVPLSRLSYGVYLIHFIVIKFFALRNEHPIYAEHDIVFAQFVANLTISYVLAFLLYLFVEAPFVGLEKFIFKRK